MPKRDICRTLAPVLSLASFFGVFLCLFLSGFINIIEFGVFSLILLITATIMKFLKNKIRTRTREAKFEKEKSVSTDFIRSPQKVANFSPKRSPPKNIIVKDSPNERKISSPADHKQFNMFYEVPHHFDAKKNQRNRISENQLQRKQQSDETKYDFKMPKAAKYEDKNVKEAKYDFKSPKAAKYEDKNSKETKYEYKSPKAAKYEDKNSKETKYEYKSPKVAKYEEKNVKEAKYNFKSPRATKHEDKNSKETKYEYKSPRAAKYEDKNIKVAKSDDESLYIIIAFENSNDFYPLRKTLKLNTTIHEIKKIVINECDIKDEIEIKYKKYDRKIPIEDTKTISDIKDKIKEKESNGKYSHYLYVEIISKKSSISKSLSPKRVKVKKPTVLPTFNDYSDDDDDDDADDVNAISQTKTFKTKRKVSPKNYIPKVTDYIESSEPEEIHKKSVKKPVNSAVKPAEKNSPGKEVKKSKSGSKKIKYLYQINKDKSVKEIELDPEATVKTMRSELAKIHNVHNVANVKILFAGKDLTDDIRLQSLKIPADNVLFIYIRSEEDILLMTAKALRV